MKSEKSRKRKIRTLVLPVLFRPPTTNYEQLHYLADFYLLSTVHCPLLLPLIPDLRPLTSVLRDAPPPSVLNLRKIHFP